MNNFEKIPNSIIQNVLQTEDCVYLCGNMKIPQKLNEIKDDKIEIGYCSYKKFEAKKPHYHPYVTEYQLLLSGECKYLDLENGEEHLVKEGDFYIIKPNMKYIQKINPGAKILFVKAPGGNDKTLLEMTDRIRAWAESWDAKY